MFLAGVLSGEFAVWELLYFCGSQSAGESEIVEHAIETRSVRGGLATPRLPSAL